MTPVEAARFRAGELAAVLPPLVGDTADVTALAAAYRWAVIATITSRTVACQRDGEDRVTKTYRRWMGVVLSATTDAAVWVAEEPTCTGGLMRLPRRAAA